MEWVAERGPFTAYREPLSGRSGTRLHFRNDAAPMSWREVAALWVDDTAFRQLSTEALAAMPYEAFFWETAPTSRAAAERPYSQVVLDAPRLARCTADPSAFQNHFDGGPIVRFPNLGGEADLVVPRPAADDAYYTHLACFLRSAPEFQRDALFFELGIAIEERWARDPGPVWVSTSGMGVPWVHVRLDARPKYYLHKSFKSFSAP